MGKPVYDYRPFDRPEILMYLFYPRCSQNRTIEPGVFAPINIPVDDGIVIGGRFFIAEENAPTILFFHGNGEIVEDYDDLGVLYKRTGLNFFPVDYRGYGDSTGRPTVSAMMNDCHTIYDFYKTHKKNNGLTGPLLVMGRSLGSASAIELASSYPDEIDGLIIESGFARALPLLRLLGIDVDGLGLSGDGTFDNDMKIVNYTNPTLIIHAEYDNIIPYHEAEILYEKSPSTIKELVQIQGADHNTIFIKDLNLYINSVVGFAKSLM